MLAQPVVVKGVYEFWDVRYTSVIVPVAFCIFQVLEALLHGLKDDREDGDSFVLIDASDRHVSHVQHR
eukprot:scaffold370_cov349-Pavlova_lutheri.AAC.41